MRYYNLVIGDEDYQYNKNLATYINSDERKLFKAKGFSEENILGEYVKNNSIDILLITPSMIKDVYTKKAKCVILLSTGKIPNKIKEIPAIYKYQSVNSIVKEILNIYSDYNQDHILNKDTNTQIVGVYSPIGRVGKTTIAISLASLIGKSKKVLYLNLEPLNTISCFLQSNNQYNLSDLLYYIKQKHPNLLLKLEGIKETINSIDYVSSVRCYIDLFETNIDEWRYLLSTLKEESDYEVIVMNFSNSFYEYTVDLLNECDKNFVVLVPEKTSFVQIKEWQHAMSLLKQDKLFEKIVYVVNNQEPNYNLAYIPDYLKDYIQIPYEEQLLSESNDFYIQHNNQFGQAISQLIQTLKE
ncbi:MAG: hypothetical protein ACLFMO_03470 [Eubacteriales bacterium]